MSITFVDNSEEILKAFDAASIRALVKCGMKAHEYSAKLVPVDTGALRNSLAFKVDPSEPAAYIGSNSEYAAYVELGTGKYVAGGRPTPWVYQDGKGNWHHTNGQRAQPYLKPAVADHPQTYKRIIEDEMKNG